jgi:hypothetical protein
MRYENIKAVLMGRICSSTDMTLFILVCEQQKLLRNLISPYSNYSHSSGTNMKKVIFQKLASLLSQVWYPHPCIHPIVIIFVKNCGLILKTLGANDLAIKDIPQI